MCASVQAAPAGEPTTLEQLQQVYEPNLPPSDFVVVIDTSGSMKQPPEDPRYARVQTAFGQLVDALPDRTHLTVLTFDTVVEEDFNGMLAAAEKARAKALPPSDGQHTDIGAALGAAVDALDRPDAAPVQTVIFITDGKPDPLPTSAYAQIGNAAWSEARAKADAIASKRDVRVYPFGLGPEGKAGAELAQQVFAGVEPVLNVPNDQLAAELSKAAVQARRDSLRSAIQAEIADHPLEVDAQPSGGLSSAVKVAVTVTSTMPNLGVDLELQSLSATDQNGDTLRVAVQNDDLVRHIPPGGSTSFDVVVKPAVRGTSFFRLPPPKREELDVKIDVSNAANATPTKLLTSRLDVDTAVSAKQPQPFTVARTVGRTWAGFMIDLVILALVLFVAQWVFRNIVMRPPLYGALVPVSNFAQRVNLSGRTRLVRTSDFGWPDADPRVKFFTKRMKRGKVFVKTVGNGRLQRQDGITQTWDNVPDGAQVGIGQYRFGSNSTTGWTWSVDRDELASSKGAGK